VQEEVHAASSASGTAAMFIRHFNIRIYVVATNAS
jgi:hypothetical protein